MRKQKNDQYDDMPSKSDIVEYWENFFAQNGKDLNIYPRVMLSDVGEPDCWACGAHNKEFGDIFKFVEAGGGNARDVDIRDKYLYRMWNFAKLERHHILPKSLGGNNDPSNLFLLCPTCHRECPHVDDVYLFFAWARAQEQNVTRMYMRGIEEALSLFGEGNNFELAELMFCAWKLKKHPLHNEIENYVSLRPKTFHGESAFWVTFRDEFFYALKCYREKGWTIEYLESCRDKMLDTLRNEYEE